MKYLLDANVCIQLLTGRSESVTARFRAEQGRFCLCAPVKAEMIAGAHKSARVEDNLQLFNDFWQDIPSLSFDDTAAYNYGEIRTALQKAGTPRAHQLAQSTCSSPQSPAPTI